MKTILIVVIVLIVGAGFFILAFFIPRKYLQTNNQIYPSDNYGCVSGRVYDPSKGLCVVQQGGSCQNFGDCESNSYCNAGICISRDSPQGDVDENCPCNEGLVCASDGKCKYQDQQLCTNSNQCLSNFCSNSNMQECQDGQQCLCTERSRNGSKCTNNNGCISGNCSLGICQYANVNTGDIGSYCTSSSKCNNSTCYQGICREGDKGFYEPCNVCDPSLLCSSGTTQLCMTTSNCQKNNCLVGYKCRNGLCLGDTNSLVTFVEQCLSGKSSGSGGISSLPYDIYGQIPRWSIEQRSNVLDFQVRDSILYTLTTSNDLLVDSNIYASGVNSFCINSSGTIFYQDIFGEYYRDRVNQNIPNNVMNQGMASYQGIILVQIGSNIYNVAGNLFYTSAKRILNNGYIDTSGTYFSFENQAFDIIPNVQDCHLSYDDGKWNGIVLNQREELYLVQGSYPYPFKSYYFDFSSRVRYQNNSKYYLSNKIICG